MDLDGNARAVTIIDSEECYKWSSDSNKTYTISKMSESPLKESTHGTMIVCHLKEDSREFLNNYTLKTLINKYSQYINYDIQLKVDKEIENIVQTNGELGVSKLKFIKNK